MRRIVTVLVLLLGFHDQIAAQVVLHPQCDVPPPPPGVFRYTIDLAKGLTEGKTRYKVIDEVQIVFKNKNPFLYDYRFRIEAREVPEPALDTFFRLFNTSPTATLQALNLIRTTPQDLADPSLTLACTNASTQALSRLTAEENNYKRLYDSSKQQAENILPRLADLKDSILAEERRFSRPEADCPTLIDSATTLVSRVNRDFDETVPGLGQDLSQFQKSFQDLEASASRQAQLIGTVQEDLRRAQCTNAQIDRVVTPFQNNLRNYQRDLQPQIQKTATEFGAFVKEAKQKAKEVSDVLKSPQNFTEVQQVGSFDTITEVSVRIDRKDRQASTFPTSTYLEKKLRFGGRQRFALAAGAAFSPMDLTTYKSVQGIVLNASGAPILDNNQMQMFARIVGEEEDASQRVVPLIVLHTRLFNMFKGSAALHFSFGFAGQAGGNGVNLEYLVGPSIGFAEERAFITFGAYNGRTTVLQDGFYVGRALPQTISDPPVIRDRDWDWGFAATYRFR